jgi:hypothetical protein
VYDPNWLEELREQLARRKLPPAYVARLMGELSDHVTDLMEDQMSTDALESRNVFERLGAPQDVAQQAAAEYRRRSFCGRHPILIFVVLPVVTLVALFYAELTGLAGLGMVLKSAGAEWSSDRFSPTAAGGMRLFCTGSLLVPAALTAMLFAWLGAKTGVPRKWPAITCVFLGLLAAASHMDLYMSPLPNQSRLTLGLGFSTAITALFVQLSKFAVPVLIGMWMFKRRMRASSRAVAA